MTWPRRSTGNGLPSLSSWTRRSWAASRAVYTIPESSTWSPARRRSTSSGPIGARREIGGRVMGASRGTTPHRTPHSQDDAPGAVGVAVEVDRDREAGDVGRVALDVHRERGHPSPESGRADAEIVDPAEQVGLDFGEPRVGVGLAHRPEERALAQERRLLERPAHADADDERRARVRPR